MAATLDAQVSVPTFLHIQVEFSNLDRSLFVFSPCCGATGIEMPPLFQFEFTVSRNVEHCYVVMNPPYSS
jgi:hypothetical protein